MLVTLVAVLAGPGVAEGASLSVGVSPDAAEDRPLVFTASGTADGASTLSAIVRPAGGAACAATRSTDVGGDTVFDRSVSAGSYSETRNFTLERPRAYLLCGWISRGGVTEATASIEFTVRPNAATVALELPAAAVPDQPLVVTARGATELSRSLFATFKPAGGAGCGSAYSTDSGGEILFDRSVTGSFAEQRQRSFAAGAYLLCAWIQESSSDLEPEAVASATLSVLPPDADGDGVPDATDRCPARAGAGGTGCPPRVAPLAVTAKASPKRDRLRPYRFGFSGRLRPPTGLLPAEACRGNVIVQIKRGATTISSRRRGIRADCTWSSAVAFANRARVGRGRLTAVVRFLGNDVLLPLDAARRLRIRAG